MKHSNLTWSINELINCRKEINPKPQYQRTPVWVTERKALLIDSILQGFDLPKFYVYQYPEGSKFRFEVADGQQRMRAILEFYDGVYPLSKNTKIEGMDFSNQFYNSLPEDIQETFKKYDLAFTEIYEARTGEMNELFKRLQRGVSLNPPELRHAMYSEIGFYINSFLEKPIVKSFFEKSGINDIRFKHQEYLDHVIALIHFKNKRDLKAALMSQLYIDFESSRKSEFKNYFDKAETILEKLSEINSYKKGIFKNKWAFVDFFWLFFRNLAKIEIIDPQIFSALLSDFESERLKFNSNPERLLKLKRVQFGESMFHYIQAFNKEGAKKENIQIRASVLDQAFKGVLN